MSIPLLMHYLTRLPLPISIRLKFFRKKKPELCLEDKGPHKSDDICPEAECSPSSVQRNIRITDDFGPSSILKDRIECLESPPKLPSQGGAPFTLLPY